MFFLSLIEHTLRLPPYLLSLPLPEAIQGELEKLFVDKEMVLRPTRDEDGRWTWMFGDVDLTIEQGDEIRFRIHKISYPPTPLEQETGSRAFAPMVITASIDFDGLGPISWWV